MKNSKFADVARTVANGDPPDWLVLGLEHFGGSIGVDISKKDRRHFDNIVKQMQGAVHILQTWAPMWLHAGFGLQCPEHVVALLYALPRVKKDLDIFAKKQIGRRPDENREICAAVIVEAWKLLHGKVEPNSLKFQRACNEYWRACGGKQIGGWDEPENWRRPVERALTTGHGWIEKILLAVQNAH
jgi:hypothetical protein